MISIKTEHEIEIMRKAGRITAGARAVAGDMVKPGVTTAEIDKAVHDYILSQGATPSFLGYGGFPGSACISINDVVIHGIPGEQVIQEGDIVSVDVGAYWGGFHGDCCATFIAGETDELSKKLVRVTRESFFEGIKYARKGFRLGDVSHAIQSYVEAAGFSVIRDYVGHGIGRDMHEDPPVPNYGKPDHGPRLVPGMCLAIEPMIAAGKYQVKVLSNDWTVVTVDGSNTAHYENTVVITDGEPRILTCFDRDVNALEVSKEERI